VAQHLALNASDVQPKVHLSSGTISGAFIKHY